MKLEDIENAKFVIEDIMIERRLDGFSEIEFSVADSGASGLSIKIKTNDITDKEKIKRLMVDEYRTFLFSFEQVDDIIKIGDIL